MKHSYSLEMPPAIRRISNSCKVVEYSHVAECKYELCHIPRRSHAWASLNLGGRDLDC